jgi:methionyl-tRNA synthetase
MLLGLNLPLPKTLYVHGFINIDGQKMSKSLGNSIDPVELIANFGPDPIRYYLLRHIPSYSDGDFSISGLITSYNNELANELGNAVSRTIAMIELYSKGLIGDIPSPEHDIAAYEEAIKNCRLDRALETVFEEIKGLNQYIEEEKPWELAKSEDKDHLKEVLAYLAGNLLQIADLLEPFLPETANKIKAAFEGGKVHKMTENLFPKIDND